MKQLNLLYLPKNKKYEDLIKNFNYLLDSKDKGYFELAMELVKGCSSVRYYYQNKFSWFLKLIYQSTTYELETWTDEKKYRFEFELPIKYFNPKEYPNMGDDLYFSLDEKYVTIIF